VQRVSVENILAERVQVWGLSCRKALHTWTTRWRWHQCMQRFGFCLFLSFNGFHTRGIWDVWRFNLKTFV